MNEDFSIYNGEGTPLRRAQLKMLDILIEVDHICKKNGIIYWIDYGTLLGAVRHGGFIPWDDDLDISIMRKDFLKLSKLLKEELPPTMAFQDWKNENKLTLKVGKVRDLNSYYDEGLTKRGEMKYQGIFIDIFPVDYIPSYKIKKKIDYFYGRAFRRIRGIKNNRFEKTLALFIWPSVKALEYISRTISFLNKKKRISNIYGGLNLPVSHLSEDIFPVKEIEFESHSFSAPKNIDKYLKEIYGDYWKIPPKEKRMTHALKIEFLD